VELGERAIGETERERHASAADPGHDPHTGRRFRDEVRSVPMHRVHAMPSLGQPPIGQPEVGAHLIEDELIDLRPIEDVRCEPVFVRVAERDRAIGGLGNERVNLPSIVSRPFSRDSRAESV
jgi:hypothetical protein